MPQLYTFSATDVTDLNDVVDVVDVASYWTLPGEYSYQLGIPISVMITMMRVARNHQRQQQGGGRTEKE